MSGWGAPPVIRGADGTVREFSAVTDCPACDDLDVHWLAEPRRKPAPDDSPAAKLMNKTLEYMSAVSLIMLDPGPPSGTYVAQPPYEPEDATVARICRKCSYIWGEK